MIETMRTWCIHIGQINPGAVGVVVTREWLAASPSDPGSIPGSGIMSGIQAVQIHA